MNIATDSNDLLVCTERWSARAAVCKPRPLASQAATMTRSVAVRDQRTCDTTQGGAIRPGCLYGHRTMHRDAMHESPLRQGVILSCAVLGTAVIPQQYIAHLPLMPIQEGRLEDKLGQRLNER